jgi:peptidoglycan/xylan/chitin deacetylase (PgdA/CDA1 family)
METTSSTARVSNQTGQRVIAPGHAITQAGPGLAAMVISLDFELYWGVRDQVPLDRAERSRLLAARALVPKILDLFEEFSIHATWATVGLLFARTKQEAEAFRPKAEPGYVDQRLNPYRESLGASEADDPFHFAPSLISLIASKEGQEIASHSFSHYYCMEPGQTNADFEADLRGAIAIADYAGYKLQSYVFPRNQVNPDYIGILQRYGIRIYRGNEEVGIKQSAPFSTQRRIHKRVGRLLDAYVGVCGDQVAVWPSQRSPALIRPSRYLRSSTAVLRYLEPRLLQRMNNQMKAAVEQGQIFHLWWHPEDFAADGDHSLRFLRRVLTTFNAYRETYGMKSLSMAETLVTS